MAYTLEEARVALKGRLLWLANPIVREPLEGLVDGTNKVFHLPYAPAQADSVVVYDHNGAVFSSTLYAVDEEAGSVVFGTAFSTAYTASYTYQALTDTKMLALCGNGFDIMQRMYPRALYIVSSGSSSYISSTSASVVDPTLGTVTFSASRIQQSFLATCAEVALLNALIQQAGVESLDIREGITGMRIDRTKRVAPLMSILGEAKERAAEEAEIAADEAGDSTEFEGGVFPGAKSDMWIDWFDWYDDSKQDRGIVP